MTVFEEVLVNAPRHVVWEVVSSIESAADTLSGVDQVEILERPASGLAGLRWRESRTMFGKTATETMWVTGAEEGSGYETEARSHGSIYRSRVRLADAPQGTLLGMEFSAEPLTLPVRVMSMLLRPLMARSVSKALRQDLLDLKAAAESRAESNG